MPAALYHRAARRHWRVVAVFAALGGLLLGLLGWLEPASYRAEVQLRVSFALPEASSVGPEAGASAVAVAAALGVERRYVEFRVRSYTLMATSMRVMRVVVAQLRLPYSAAQLNERVAASTPLDSTFIDIAVVDTDARRALAVGEAVAAELARSAASESTVDVTSAPRIEPTRTPRLPDQPLERPWLVRVVAGLLGGLAIGLGIGVLRELLHGRGETFATWARQQWVSGISHTVRYSRLVKRRISTRFWGPGWL